MQNNNAVTANASQFFLWEYLRNQCNQNRPIVMYGTGDGAEKILTVMEQYGLKPECFTATGDFKMKPTFRGVRVVAFEEVEKTLADPVILICFGSDKPDVLERLYALSEKYEVYAPDVPVIGDGHYTPEYVQIHREEIDRVRDLFADEKSREVFDGWLEYRLSGRLDVLQRISSPRSEIYTIANPGHDEFFIDAGAFKGDTVEEFLAFVDGGYRKITAIEPDVKNYAVLSRKFAQSENIITVNSAAWCVDESVEFTVKTGRGGSVEQNSDMSTGVKKVVIEGVKIDTLCGDGKPTLIKIDVEGAEEEVLKGAKSVIKQHSPKLIVSLYHRNEALFRLPLLIHSYNPGYRFYLRKTLCLPGWEFQLIVMNNVYSQE